MITPGRYSVSFKTLVGEGAGMVEFTPDGKLRGGDYTFAYDGSWTQEAGRFRAALCAKRVVPGPPGVFGMDEVNVIIAGRSDGGSSIVCAGFAKESPGLRLDVVLSRAEVE